MTYRNDNLERSKYNFSRKDYFFYFLFKNFGHKKVSPGRKSSEQCMHTKVQILKDTPKCNEDTLSNRNTKVQIPEDTPKCNEDTLSTWNTKVQIPEDTLKYNEDTLSPQIVKIQVSKQKCENTIQGNMHKKSTHSENQLITVKTQLTPVKVNKTPVKLNTAANKASQPTASTPYGPHNLPLTVLQTKHGPKSGQ